MYRKRLKQKAMLLVVLLGFLIILIMPDREQKEPERGEELILPGKEEEEEYTVEPEEVWEMPGADAKIRVLILAEDGGIFHEEKEPAREYPGSCSIMRRRRAG